MEINGTLSAIVTGGASGLGAATARMLSSMGAKVAIFDLDIEKGSTILSNNKTSIGFEYLDHVDLRSRYDNIQGEKGQLVYKKNESYKE